MTDRLDEAMQGVLALLGKHERLDPDYGGDVCRCEWRGADWKEHLAEILEADFMARLEERRALPPMPKGMGETWEMTFDAERWRELDQTAARRAGELREDGTDPKTDLDYVNLRNSALLYENAYLRERANAIAHATRTENHRQLGKAYGRASRTIRELRDKIALLEERNVLRIRRGQGYAQRLRVPSHDHARPGRFNWSPTGNYVEATKDNQGNDGVNIHGISLDPREPMYFSAWYARYLALALLGALDYIDHGSEEQL